MFSTYVGFQGVQFKPTKIRCDPKRVCYATTMGVGIPMTYVTRYMGCAYDQTMTMMGSW